MKENFEFKHLSTAPDYIAPDKSEIRLLPTFERGGLCHCTLPVAEISKAVKHKNVEEVWFCVSGNGVIWQKNDAGESERNFCGGDSFTIPAGNSFQFRNTGTVPLCLIISTMPKWPGPHEAIEAEGKWNESRG